MLKTLSIKNYAIIESLQIDFDSGFSVITGETGAGKSILLGALSLILGNRTSYHLVKDNSKKCIVEANFDIRKFEIKDFFNQNNIDYENITTIRREINPKRRSRAFINDTPVKLSVIKQLSSKLIDIHSQHQSLDLNDANFQLNVVDAYSKIFHQTDLYKEKFLKYKKKKLELSKIIEKINKANNENDYYKYRFDELNEANLKKNEQKELEQELQLLNNTETIQKHLLDTSVMLTNEENGIAVKLHECISNINNIRNYLYDANSLSKRLESTKIELEDIADEIEIKMIDTEQDPERITILNERLNQIYSLQNKHNVKTIEELISVKDSLFLRINELTSLKESVSKIEKQLSLQHKKLIKISDEISSKRKKAFPYIENKIIEILTKLGMPTANFKISHKKSDNFMPSGRDIINFLFSANAHIDAKKISKIASGGEISRLMLSVKSVIADSIALPTIIFDEIDTGISGDIADKTGNIMKKMSVNMQVINITHLPQVASKAHKHYFVYKVEKNNSTNTNIKILNKKERIIEIAKMLSGENITDAAIKNAKELLKN